VLQCVWCHGHRYMLLFVMQEIAMNRSVLQCVAACCCVFDGTGAGMCFSS